MHLICAVLIIGLILECDQAGGADEAIFSVPGRSLVNNVDQPPAANWVDDQPWRVRLPNMDQSPRPRHTNLPPPPGWTAAEFASLGSSPESEPLLPGDRWTEETGRLASHKDGFFQKLSFSAAWLNRSGPSDLGLTELKTFLTVAVPLPSKDFPLLITPGFDVTVLNGPDSPDLPPQVYDTYLDFMWLPKLSEGWLGILSLAPGLYSDFDHLQNDAFRLKGKALIRYDWIPERLQLMAGVLYLNRNDVNWLPAGGLIWTPNDKTHLELLFPRPKFSRRVMRTGLHEDWLYMSGEFGGDTWSIRRASGEFDMITLRDWRIFFGLERKRDGGAGHRFEVGYVFSRDVQYDSATPDYQSDPAVMLCRGGLLSQS